jgi:hypothetical protein
MWLLVVMIADERDCLQNADERDWLIHDCKMKIAQMW